MCCTVGVSAMRLNTLVLYPLYRGCIRYSICMVIRTGIQEEYPTTGGLCIAMYWDTVTCTMDSEYICREMIVLYRSAVHPKSHTTDTRQCPAMPLQAIRRDRDTPLKQ